MTMIIDALKKAEAQLKLLTEAGNIGLWDLDLSTGKACFSPEWKRQIGYLDHEIPDDYREWENRIHPDDLSHATATLQSFIQKTRPDYINEYRFRHRDGSHRWIMATASLMHDEKDRPVQMLGCHIDITERKEQEEALRQSKEIITAEEKRYHDLFEGIRDAILVVDADRKLLDCNQSFVDIFGYDKGEIQGRKTEFLFNDAEQYENHGKSIKSHVQEPSFLYTVTYRKKSGEVFTGETSVFYLKDSHGEVSACIKLIRDISERREIEDRIRKREARFRSMVENLFDAVIVINVNSNIRFVNRAACLLFDRAEEELIGIPFGFPISSGEAQEIDIIRKSGIVRNAEIKVASDEWDGEPIFLVSIRDITDMKNQQLERIELEKQLQQIQKIEAIGTLAGGIAHDFNNILTPIIGFTQLVQERAKDDEFISDCLAEVFQSSCRAKDLVHQILTFSRQSKDTGYQPILVEPLIIEVSKLLRAALPTTIDIRLDIGSHGMILGDATEIHQILMNLCTNAKHAMETSGGILKISLRDVLLTEARAVSVHPDLQPGPYIHLQVSDTGCGIEPSITEKIFEPYFTTKEHGKGTGLGLSVVHGIVHNHHGVITVDSRMYQGTTFDIYIPQVAVQKETKAQAELELPKGHERILLVDDEPSILKLNTRILERLGYTVTVRSSSLEALALFTAKPDSFDLILTDMTMSQLRGDQLAAKCLAVRPDIPVVLLTGFSEILTEEKASKIGIRAIVMKPVTRLELAQTIRSVLQATS
jgi:PAS domain S-box-containing protein